jgi:hypothetical protein
MAFILKLTANLAVATANLAVHKGFLKGVAPFWWDYLVILIWHVPFL